MVQLRESPVDAPESHLLLTEYFGIRAEIFPGGGYRTVYPDQAMFSPPRGVFLILEDGGPGAPHPQGCGGIRRLDDGPSGIRYELKHLYVRPAGRGRGWGRMLVDELERRARSWGAAELVLDTHHTLEAAGSLYSRSGFEQTEPYNDNPNATRWYRKTLT